MVWPVLFVAAVGVFVIVARRPLAKLQAALAGGSVLPGCVIAEGVLLLLLALALFVLYRAGAFA
jgi:hypothetical protein